MPVEGVLDVGVVGSMVSLVVVPVIGSVVESIGAVVGTITNGEKCNTNLGILHC